MKKIILVTCFLLLSVTMTYANRTLRVSGELTGAGSRYSVKILVGLIHNREVIPVEKVQKIFTKNSSNPMISDIEKVEISGRVLGASEFEGFIVKD